MINKTSALLKANLTAALLGTASLGLPCGHAQPSAADRQALAQLRAKAEQGNAKTQIELGEAFGLGKLNVATNWVDAVKWWRKATQRNVAQAQFNLGFCFYSGAGVARDAAEWLALRMTWARVYPRTLRQRWRTTSSPATTSCVTTTRNRWWRSIASFPMSSAHDSATRRDATTTPRL